MASLADLVEAEASREQATAVRTAAAVLTDEQIVLLAESVNGLSRGSITNLIRALVPPERQRFGIALQALVPPGMTLDNGAAGIVLAVLKAYTKEGAKHVAAQVMDDIQKSGLHNAASKAEQLKQTLSESGRTSGAKALFQMARTVGSERLAEMLSDAVRAIGDEAAAFVLGRTPALDLNEPTGDTSGGRDALPGIETELPE